MPLEWRILARWVELIWFLFWATESVKRREGCRIGRERGCRIRSEMEIHDIEDDVYLEMRERGREAIRARLPNWLDYGYTNMI